MIKLETQFILQGNTKLVMMFMSAALTMHIVSISTTTVSVIVCLDIF